MSGAFQSNAFQNNAFQVESAHIGVGQAQAQITTKTPNAQAQADIKATSNAYAQAQGTILVSNNTKFGQARAFILKLSIGQAQAYIIQRFGKAHAQAKISNPIYSWAQANATIANRQGFAQTQGLINARFKFGQTQAKIADSTANVRVSQAPIETILRPNDAQVRASQAPIEALVRPNDAQVRLTQAPIEVVIKPNDAKDVISQFAIIVLVKNFVYGTGQAQANIRGITFAYGQAQADVKATSNAYGQCQADIKATSQGYGQAQGKITATYQGYGQAQCYTQSFILVFGQAQGQITNTTPNGQAQASIKNTYYPLAQAQADIKTVQYVFGQAQVSITSHTPSGQAQAFINQSLQSGQAQARIKNTYVPTGQSQALLQTKFNIKRGQAQARIKTKFRKPPHGKPFPWLDTGQVQALIRRPEGYGQAQAYVQLNVGYGQAQCTILRGINAYGQAMCWITGTQAYGQAMAVIIHAGFGQAQGLIKTQPAAYGQAQGQIGKRQGIGQAQCQIKNFFISRCGQAQGYIRKSAGYGQAQGNIKAKTQGYGQAQCFLGHAHTGQAQAYINSNKYLVKFNNYPLPGYAQAEAYESVETIFNGKIDGGLTEYLGLKNKVISLRMLTVSSTLQGAKEEVTTASTIVRSKYGFAKLFIQYQNKYYLVMTKTITNANDARANIRTTEYNVEFEAKPWLIDVNTTTISGTGLVTTTGRTLYDGGWTPARIRLTGTDVTISGYTETGEFTGFVSVSGSVANLEINSESYTVTENGISKNYLMNNLDYAIYVGPGVTNFQVTGASMCEISYENRWYL